jgi:hypothetical protein
MLNVILLSVVILNVDMLSVVVPEIMSVFKAKPNKTYSSEISVFVAKS